MNIGGALGTIGNAKLQGYLWGSTVVGIVNTHLPLDQQVTLLDSGLTVTERVMSLEDDITARIMALEIGPLEGAVCDPGYHKKTLVSTISIGLGVVMTIVVIVMSMHSQDTALKAGTAVNLGWVGQMVEPLLEVLKFIKGD